MRKYVLIGIVATIALGLGVTTRARQRGVPAPEHPMAIMRPTSPPHAGGDFVPAGAGHLFRRDRIEHVRFVAEGRAEVYLIGREPPVVLEHEEAKRLRAALTAAPGLDPRRLEPPLDPRPEDGRPEPSVRPDSPFRLLPDPE